MSAIWGWLLVCSANFCMGLILSEICSAYPTSGGVYYWTHRLGGECQQRQQWAACGTMPLCDLVISAEAAVGIMPQQAPCVNW